MKVLKDLGFILGIVLFFTFVMMGITFAWLTFLRVVGV